MAIFFEAVCVIRSLFNPHDFNYTTDGYEGDGPEDVKSQDGSETMPFIDESPTMSPQLCTPHGDAASPSPPEGLLPGSKDSEGMADGWGRFPGSSEPE
ncbi:unnamed protein product [Boreogadus saida]